MIYLLNARATLYARAQCEPIFIIERKTVRAYKLIRAAGLSGKAGYGYDVLYGVD